MRAKSEHEKVITSSVPGAYDGMSVKLTAQEPPVSPDVETPDLEEPTEQTEEIQTIAQPTIDDEGEAVQPDLNSTDTGVTESQESIELTAKAS